MADQKSELFTDPHGRGSDWVVRRKGERCSPIRLKAGCGQDWPPHNAASRKLMDGSGLRTACPTTPPENLRGLRRS